MKEGHLDGKAEALVQTTCGTAPVGAVAATTTAATATAASTKRAATATTASTKRAAAAAKTAVAASHSNSNRNNSS